jgi:hypothetical protein
MLAICLRWIVSIKIGVSVMMKRRRFKQTVSFKDRLCMFAKHLREQALLLPAGPEKDAILKRARRAETAAQLDEWARSPGLQSPT